MPGAWPLSVSVNLPAEYLTKEQQVEEILSMISENGTPPHSIRLEITENQLMGNAELIRKALADLSRFGIRVYIDDFGTGFSSLSYLSSFQADALKVDQSFVRGLNGNDKNSALVRSIVSLGQNLGIDVIAEGIETEDQLGFLRAVKCQYGQGFYFARPLEPEKVGKSLARWFAASGEKQMLVSRLRIFPLFAQLDDEALLEIAQICEEVRMPSGTVVIRKGQAGEFAFLMEDGFVGVYRGETDHPESRAVLRAPAVFGEMALVRAERIQTANVKALSDLRLLSIPIIPCLSLLRRFPALKENLLQMAAERSSQGLS